jgi:hypothetical protein
MTRQSPKTVLSHKINMLSTQRPQSDVTILVTGMMKYFGMPQQTAKRRKRILYELLLCDF